MRVYEEIKNRIQKMQNIILNKNDIWQCSEINFKDFEIPIENVEWEWDEKKGWQISYAETACDEYEETCALISLLNSKIITIDFRNDHSKIYAETLEISNAFRWIDVIYNYTIIKSRKDAVNILEHKDEYDDSEALLRKCYGL